MDSESMSRNSMNRKRNYRGPSKKREPGKKREPKQKVYCILTYDRWVYFPIAAQLSPYIIDGKRVESYLAGMPNFFGGNKNQNGEGMWEDNCTALAREIREESQDNIQVEIFEEALKPLVSSKDEKGNTYCFYLVRMENDPVPGIDFQGDAVFPLIPYENVQESITDVQRCCYEDSHLVRMDVGNFQNFVRSLLDMEAANTEERRENIRTLLNNLGISWEEGRGVGVDRWYESHTAVAFFRSINNLQTATE